jgi:transposase-like protein
MSQEGCHGTRLKFSMEYMREAVAMLHASCVTINQIAAEMGIGATVLGRWRPELRRELVAKERDFFREAAACFASASR